MITSHDFASQHNKQQCSEEQHAPSLWSIGPVRFDLSFKQAKPGYMLLSFYLKFCPPIRMSLARYLCERHEWMSDVWARFFVSLRSILENRHGMTHACLFLHKLVCCIPMSPRSNVQILRVLQSLYVWSHVASLASCSLGELRESGSVARSLFFSHYQSSAFNNKS